MADEFFEAFLNGKGFAPPIPGKPVPQATLDKYTGVLPDALLAIWAEFGWAGFGDGRFWLTDPDEWAMAYGEWFGRFEPPLKDTFHVIARNAFGDFDCWGARTGPSLHLDVVNSMLYVTDRSAKLHADGPD